MECIPEIVGRSDQLLVKLSNVIAQAQKESWGKGPERAKSYLIDDFLLVVSRGGLTKAEETLLKAGEVDHVRKARQTLQHHEAARYIEPIEALTGRTVVTYQSQILLNPTILLDIFFFDALAAGEDATLATPAAQPTSGLATRP